MRYILQGIFILFLLFGISGCAEEGEKSGKDYMPFTTSGFLLSWGKSATIKIYLPTDAVASSVTGYVTGFEAAFKAGISEWSTALSNLGVTVDYTGTIQNNDIKVIWNDGSGVATGVLGFAAVDTATDPSRYIFMTTRENYTSGFPSHSTSTIKAITAHEFGHMLGIWSHSFEDVDLMYPFLQSRTTPSSRDKATMEYLYEFSPDLNLDNLSPILMWEGMPMWYNFGLTSRRWKIKL